jgi:hypothetical protein
MNTKNLINIVNFKPLNSSVFFYVDNNIYIKMIKKNKNLNIYKKTCIFLSVYIPFIDGMLLIRTMYSTT